MHAGGAGPPCRDTRLRAAQRKAPPPDATRPAHQGTGRSANGTVLTPPTPAVQEKDGSCAATGRSASATGCGDDPRGGSSCCATDGAGDRASSQAATHAESAWGQPAGGWAFPPRRASATCADGGARCAGGWAGHRQRPVGAGGSSCGASGWAGHRQRPVGAGGSGCGAGGWAGRRQRPTGVGGSCGSSRA